MHKIVSPDLASPQFKANPHPFYARLREEAPVWRTSLLEQLGTDPQLIKPAIEELLRYTSPAEIAT
jgi:hypothetical protein